MHRCLQAFGVEPHARRRTRTDVRGKSRNNINAFCIDPSSPKVGKGNVISRLNTFEKLLNSAWHLQKVIRTALFDTAHGACAGTEVLHTGFVNAMEILLW